MLNVNNNIITTSTGSVKTEQVDGKKIKEDTFYKLKNGKFVECKG